MRKGQPGAWESARAWESGLGEESVGLEGTLKSHVLPHAGAGVS